MRNFVRVATAIAAVLLVTSVMIAGQASAPGISGPTKINPKADVNAAGFPPPYWAYPANLPDYVAPPDKGEKMRVPNSNVAYTLHFYANTHGQWLRDEAQAALNRGVALFVTEYGTTASTGDGMVDEAATREWWAFLDRNSISHLNWSIADKREASAALMPGTSPAGGWTLAQITPSGQLVRSELRARASQPDSKESK